MFIFQIINEKQTVFLDFEKSGHKNNNKIGNETGRHVMWQHLFLPTTEKNEKLASPFENFTIKIFVFWFEWRARVAKGERTEKMTVVGTRATFLM